MYINAHTKPLVTLFGQRDESGTLRFVGRDGYIEWAWLPELFTSILMLCNGYTTVYEIAMQLKRPVRLIVEMLSLGEAYGIVVDANSLYRQFHHDDRNPPLFGNTLSPKKLASLRTRPLPWTDDVTAGISVRSNSITPLARLLSRRESCRNFRPAKLLYKQLCGLLSCLYSRSAVPSAGDLRAIMPYVYLFDPVGSLPMGLYQYRWSTEELAFLSHQPTSEELSRVFPEEHLFRNTLCAVMLTADLDRIATKYGNRAYRYAFLEAGHSAQNLYLWGAENKFGILEYGGYLDQELAITLGVDWQTQPVLTTLFIGRPSSAPSAAPIDTSRSKLEQLAQKYLGASKVVKELRTLALEGQVSVRSYATANYRLTNGLSDQHSWGNGVNLYEAQMKATAEAVERFYSASARVDLESEAENLDVDWLDPRVYAPISGKQCKLWSDLEIFDPTKNWQWVLGQHWKTRKRVLVPVDLVYYPLNAETYGRKLCWFATSSGVAAHSKIEKAVEGALLELIERNAFVLAWYMGSQSLNRLDMGKLQAPRLVSDVETYSKRGVEVSFLSVNPDHRAVVVVCLMRERNSYGRLGVGAGASFTNCTEAALKAFYEAECVWLTQSTRPIRIKSAGLIRQVEDHLNYYQYSKKQKVLERFFPKKIGAPTQVKGSVDDYDPVVVKLYQSGGLQVVRVIERNLVPISFGFGLEAYLHSTFQRAVKAGSKYTFPGKPHFFA